MNKNRDLIIIGNGLTALSCAITASTKNLDVLLLDPGYESKSFGCINELVYKHSLKKIFSNYTDYPDVFVPMSRRAFWITTPDSHTAWECFKTPDLSNPPGFVADRPAFDKLLAERFVKLGGEIRTGINVTSILFGENSESVTGVKCDSDPEKIYANMVVFAQSDNPSLADSLTRNENPQNENQVLITKQILTGENPTPAWKLTSNDNHAASIILLGDPLGVGFSWGRIIAYKNNLIIKVYVPFDLVGKQQDHKTFIERFKMHPSVESVVKGYQPVDFHSALVQAAGFNKYPEKLYGNGFIVAGQDARLYHPFDCRMTDYPIYSGIIAANAAINAKLDNRPSLPSDYPYMLRDSFLLADRNSMMAIMSSLRDKRAFSSTYPEFLFDLLNGVFTMDERRKSDKKSDVADVLSSKASTWSLMNDMSAILKLYG